MTPRTPGEAQRTTTADRASCSCHDADFELLDKLRLRWHNLKIDVDAVLFGLRPTIAGKCLHRHELTGREIGMSRIGPALLQEHGVSLERSRFSRTHGTWQHEADLALEDFIVAWLTTAGRVHEMKSLS